MPNSDKPEKLDLRSDDVSLQKQAELRALFPGVFTESQNDQGELVESIDFEKLKSELGTFSDVFESRRERYGMDWPGKKDCMKLIQQPSAATLKPDRDGSVGFDITKNLFIEGDNLEVLKLLQKSYYGKVKMIYIDPPYNTGKEFIYPDKYSESLDTYLAYAGLVDDEGKKFSTNTATEGRYHTRWLNMMYPRLYLARNLLSDDGIIFISIDDNEMTNLKKLCDDVFGEENMVSTIIVQSNKRGQTYKDIAKTHEYLLVYSRDPEVSLNELEKLDGSLPHSDQLGPYDLWELRNRNPKFGRHNRPNLYYPIYVDPSSTDSEGLCSIALKRDEKYDIEVFPRNSNGEDSCWRWGAPKVETDGMAGDVPAVVAKQKRDGDWNIYEKSRKSTTKAKSLWVDTDVISEQGTVQMGELDLAGYFDHPKPVGLIQKCIAIATDDSDIVLDFFSGSCTTAHAVYEQYVSDSKKRNYILVQLPEPCDESSDAFTSGFSTIADVGKERIRRVIKHYEEESAGQLGFNKSIQDADLGFKVLKLDRSNFDAWDGSDPSVSGEELSKQLSLYVDHIDPDASQEDILYELLLKSGFMPTEDVEKLTMAEKSVYSVSDGALLICLEDEITREVIDAIAEAEPLRFICLDRAFQGNDQLKANAVQTFDARNQGRDKADQIVFRTV